MKFADKLPSDADWEADLERRHHRDLRAGGATVVIVSVIIACWLWFVVGCASTVIPQPVGIAAEASFDGNAQNSGIIESTPNGFIVTNYFVDRYNALIADYGGNYRPNLRPDQGLTRIGYDRWLITKQAMVWMLEMNSHRRAKLPKNPPL